MYQYHNLPITLTFKFTVNIDYLRPITITKYLLWNHSWMLKPFSYECSQLLFFYLFNKIFSEPSRSSASRPLQRRDCDKNHREQAGRGGLPDLDVHLPAAHTEPQLLQPARHHSQTLVWPPVRAGGEHLAGSWTFQGMTNDTETDNAFLAPCRLSTSNRDTDWPACTMLVHNFTAILHHFVNQSIIRPK